MNGSLIERIRSAGLVERLVRIIKPELFTMDICKQVRHLSFNSISDESLNKCVRMGVQEALKLLELENQVCIVRDAERESKIRAENIDEF